MNAPTIRLAIEQDARPIAVLSRCLIEIGLRGWSWNSACVLRAIRHRDACVAVADIDRRMAGFAIAEFGDAHVHLSLLAVAATHQRNGVGRALMLWLEQSAMTAGINDIQLELRANNPGARFFYQSLGFDLVRAVRGYYGGEETALRMRKSLGIPVTASMDK